MPFLSTRSNLPEVGDRLDILRHRRAQLIAYLSMKAEAADWHGVADAAMDLRELDIEIAVRSEPQ